MAFLGMDVASVVLLIVGFYCGYWLTGSAFNAHEIGTAKLLTRVAAQMAVYLLGTSVVSSLVGTGRQGGRAGG